MMHCSGEPRALFQLFEATNHLRALSEKPCLVCFWEKTLYLCLPKVLAITRMFLLYCSLYPILLTLVCFSLTVQLFSAIDSPHTWNEQCKKQIVCIGLIDVVCSEQMYLICSHVSFDIYYAEQCFLSQVQF